MDGESYPVVVSVRVKDIRPAYENLKAWCDDPDNLYIGRKGIVFVDGERYPKEDSPFANPFKIDASHTREQVIALYREYLIHKGLDLNVLRSKKRLGCWCKPEACHGDVLVDLLRH